MKYVTIYVISTQPRYLVFEYMYMEVYVTIYVISTQPRYLVFEYMYMEV